MFPSTIRAFYRNPTGDFTLLQDSGVPGEERLRELGWRWFSVEGPEEEREVKFRELIKTLDFTGGQEHRFDLRDQKAGGPNMPQWTPEDVIHAWSQDLLLPVSILSNYFNGNTFLDVREPGTDAYIRVAIPGQKYVIYYPAGSIIQGYTDLGSKLSGVHTIFQTKKEGDPVNIVGENLDNHPVRLAYLSSLRDKVGAQA
ncbi:hypothetical protein V5O48_003677 [Marasmius crinis-equi]|uniref:Uncharacterized protein n=1 Tax=Marasmius crinis-equi TaxID=585013 RepID=A0ABR3FS75_9AGAR